MLRCMESSHVHSHSCVLRCGSHLRFKDMKQSDLAGINVACRQENTIAKWWPEDALRPIVFTRDALIDWLTGEG